MNYYNHSIPGPSSRPYDPNSFSNPSGSSTTPSSQSPNFPSYPLMTDLPNLNPSQSQFQAQAHAQVEEDELEDESKGATAIEVDDSAPLVEPHQDLDSFLESFWTRQMAVVERDNPDFKTYPLPLARIKKVMKSDEEVKMISAEDPLLLKGSKANITVPIMFSKACEIFISELTCRAWLIAETNKRRTLQKADVANAIAHSDMFDFLIDIIPRDDESPPPAATGSGSALGTGVISGSTTIPAIEEDEEDEDDEDERVFTEFVRQEEIG